MRDFNVFTEDVSRWEINYSEKSYNLQWELQTTWKTMCPSYPTSASVLRAPGMSEAGIRHRSENRALTGSLCRG